MKECLNHAILHELVDQQYSRMCYCKPEGVELRQYLCFQEKIIYLFTMNCDEVQLYSLGYQCSNDTFNLLTFIASSYHTRNKPHAKQY